MDSSGVEAGAEAEAWRACLTVQFRRVAGEGVGESLKVVQGADTWEAGAVGKRGFPPDSSIRLREN